MVLKISHTSESPGQFIKTQFAGPCPCPESAHLGEDQDSAFLMCSWVRLLPLFPWPLHHPLPCPQLPRWKRYHSYLECPLLGNSTHVGSKPHWWPEAVQVSSSSPALGFISPYSQGGGQTKGQNILKGRGRQEGIQTTLVNFLLFASTQPEGDVGAQSLATPSLSFHKADASLGDPRRGGRFGIRCSWVPCQMTKVMTS